MKANNEKELGEALHNNEDEIVIEGDLANHVWKIHIKGNVAWGVVIGCFVIAIPLVITTVVSGGTATPVTAPAAVAVIAPASGILGVGTAFSALSICAGAAACGGGVSAGIAALKKLRKYDVIKKENKVILKRK